ncbi:MAG: hypothetical protein MUC52_01265 [Candidatus Omnitrophica bacterium]|nr:hypothetical protein [Candidatus Omnitrophota bacterium]
MFSVKGLAKKIREEAGEKSGWYVLAALLLIGTLIVLCVSIIVIIIRI